MVKRNFFVVNEQIVEKRFASVIGKSEVWDFVRSLRKSLGRSNAFPSPGRELVILSISKTTTSEVSSGFS